MDEANAKSAGEPMTPEALALMSRVQEAIEEVRPTLQGDGGDIELLGITPDLRARVRLVGACCGCPSAGITLSLGVEKYLRERVPELKGLALDGEGMGSMGFGPFGFGR